MANQEISFNMWVIPQTAHRLTEKVRALNKNKELSFRNNVSEHYITATPYKEENGKVWFKITASRPYLVFRLGLEYCQ